MLSYNVEVSIDHKCIRKNKFKLFLLFSIYTVQVNICVAIIAIAAVYLSTESIFKKKKKSELLCFIWNIFAL